MTEDLKQVVWITFKTLFKGMKRNISSFNDYKCNQEKLRVNMIDLRDE